MNVQIINKKSVLASVWDGGETYEYFIFPKDALYTNRNFLFRISVATINKAPSTFTQFNNYQRFLVMLNGNLHVNLNGKEKHFSTNDVFEFQSNDFIESFTTGKDFNFMVEKNANANVVIATEWNILSSKFAFVFVTSNTTVTVNQNTYFLQTDDLLIVTNDLNSNLNIQTNNNAIIGYCN